MKIKMTNVPFKGTKEQEAELKAVIAELKDEQGALMPILQRAQDIYGYLPVEVQKIVADEMNVSLEQVFGVTTFYSQFALSPKGEHQVSICLGTACYVKGSGEVFEEFKTQLGIDGGQCTQDMSFSLDATRCLGCCGLAPVLTVNGDVYGKVTKDMVGDIIKKYR